MKNYLLLRPFDMQQDNFGKGGGEKDESKPSIWHRHSNTMHPGGKPTGSINAEGGAKYVNW